jgi:hypothetical protein
MKWLFLPLLWALAVAVAVFVLYRLWRGKPVVLRGRFSPRLVRMVVIILVTFGVGVSAERDRANAAPLPVRNRDRAADEMPATLNAEVATHWLLHQQPGSRWGVIKQDFTAVELGKLGPSALNDAFRDFPEPFRNIVVAELKARLQKQAMPAVRATELLAAVDAMEKQGYYDHWLNAYLWRKTATLEPTEVTRTVELLFTRLEQHARVTNTLIRAQARVKPVYQPPRAWMSKAGPPKGWSREGSFTPASVADLLKAAKELHVSSDTGTWKQDGIARLRLAKESPRPVLLRAGRTRLVENDEWLRLNRLDVLKTPKGEKPVCFEHAWLGTLELPAGKTLTVWDLSHGLSANAKDRVRETIKAALDNDENAAARLEQALPLVHDLLREELKKSPTAKGAPRLRLILALFDDAVMPVLPLPPKSGPVESDLIEPGVLPRGRVPGAAER